MFKQLQMLLGLAAVAALCALPSTAAPSAVPGTLNYVEGQVTVNGQAVTPKSVGSVQVEPTQVMNTAQGRAEILLTPGIFLRIGDNSSVRMVSPNLMDTRVEVLRGDAMVEATYVLKDSNVRVVLDGASTRLTKNGVYEFNANTGQVSVLDGKAVVERDDRQVDLKKGRMITLAGPLKAAKFDTKEAEQQDPLYAWSKLRSEYDAEAAMQTASTVIVGGPSWWGPGWYWDPWWGMYSFLPGDGFLYSPFGWPYYSPLFLYRTPGFYYGHPFARGFGGRAVRGGVAAPRVGGGFAGRGFVGGGFGGGGFHGGGGGFHR